MDLSYGCRSQRLLVKIIEPGFQWAAHRQFDMLARQGAVEGGNPVLQQRQLIGNLWREQVTTGRHHLTKLNPYRPQFLQGQPQTLPQRLIHVAVWHPKQQTSAKAQRQRQTHLGDQFIQAITEENADDQIQAA
ncbi:hypothetical protein D3C72_1881690 [compost metagenome]